MDFRTELKEMFDTRNGEIFDSEFEDYSDNLKEARKEIPLLYRYMPADYWNIRSLELNQIYLSGSAHMNDIFEGLSGVIDESVANKAAEMYDFVYMKSFSEQKNNLLMWGIYADNYEGMCVEYDITDMNEHEDYYYHIFPVCYSNKRYGTKMITKYVINSMRDYLIDVELGYSPAEHCEWLTDLTASFLVKSSAWEHEKEWRFIVPYVYMHEDKEYWGEGINKYDYDEMYSIKSQNVSFPYVKSIYLGPKMPETKKAHLHFIGKSIGATVYETKVSKEKYELETILKG